MTSRFPSQKYTRLEKNEKKYADHEQSRFLNNTLGTVGRKTELKKARLQ
jgi:hypothetical protein